MENKEQNFVSAVVYIRNSKACVENFLRMLVDTFRENFEHSEIICVNDDSCDESVDLIREIARTVTTIDISLVNMSYFHGLELSMNAGVDLAIGDFVFEFDNTFLNYDKSEIMRIYRHALKGYDIVSAYPDQKEKLSSRFFYKVFERFSNRSYRMHTESFRVLSRRVINRIGSMTKTVPYRKAVYSSQGLKTDSLSYTPTAGKKDFNDKKDKRYRVSLAVDSLILFTELGYRFSLFMTMIMMILSAFMIIYSIVIFAMANPVAGWTTTILFLSVAFFGLFGILTIIIRYLQLLVNLVFKRKNYSFESVEKLNQ